MGGGGGDGDGGRKRKAADSVGEDGEEGARKVGPLPACCHSAASVTVACGALQGVLCAAPCPCFIRRAGASRPPRSDHPPYRGSSPDPNPYWIKPSTHRVRILTLHETRQPCRRGGSEGRRWGACLPRWTRCRTISWRREGWRCRVRAWCPAGPLHSALKMARGEAAWPCMRALAGLGRMRQWWTPLCLPGLPWRKLLRAGALFLSCAASHRVPVPVSSSLPLALCAVLIEPGQRLLLYICLGVSAGSSF